MKWGYDRTHSEGDMEHTPQWSVLLKTEPPPGPPPVILCRRKQMLCGSYVVSYCLPATTVLIFILIQKLNKRSGENCRAEFRCCKAPTRFPEHLLPSKKKKKTYLSTYIPTYLPIYHPPISPSIHPSIAKYTLDIFLPGEDGAPGRL